METFEAISGRKSTRAFRETKISMPQIEMILNAGCSAPVASGRYDSLHIAVVQNPEYLAAVAKASSDTVEKMAGIKKNMDFGAPVLMIISSAPAVKQGIEYANAGCVLENMVIAARDLGIDSLIWGAAAAAVAESDDLKRRFCIPEGFTPLLAASFGYALNDEPSKHHKIEYSFS